MNQNKLTRAEEEIMQILWSKQKAFVKDILKEFEKPKPAYNTVSTIVRILVKKKFVSFDVFGKTHRYFPLISKEEYTKTSFKQLIKNYFGNSYKQFVSFFADNEDVTLQELEELKAMMNKKIKNKRNG